MRYQPIQYAEALYDTLEHATGGEYTARVKRFLEILKKNHDYRVLPLILARYEKIYLKKHGLRKVDVVSASPLGAGVREEIKKIIGENIVMTEHTSVGLLAGLTILV